METERKVKVKIIGLGRDNFNGEFVFEGTTEKINEQLERECRKHLISDNVSCYEGSVYAGFHCVGKLEIKEVKGG